MLEAVAGKIEACSNGIDFLCVRSWHEASNVPLQEVMGTVGGTTILGSVALEQTKQSVTPLL